jgi:transcriptional regulator with XRE-family HTH domain
MSLKSKALGQVAVVKALLAEGALPLPDACKAIRMIHGLSQDEFAKRSGVNRKVVKDLERGQGNPRWESLQRMGRVAGLRVAFLMDDGVVRLMEPRQRIAEEEARRAADAVALERGLNPKDLHARNAMSLGGLGLRLPKLA